MHDRVWGLLIGLLCGTSIGLFIGKVIGQAFHTPTHLCDRCHGQIRA